MAKKGLRTGLVVGCAVFAVVVAGLVALGAYFFVWKPGSAAVRTGVEMVQAGKDYATGLARFGEMAELNADLENREPYEPPADGELTAAQVERLVAVQRRVKTESGERLNAFSERWEHVSQGRDVRPQELATMLGEFGDLAVEAKRVQVAAMNEQDFSRQEYAWVRRQTLLALGLSGVTLNVDEVVAAVRRGDVEDALAKLESGEGKEPLVPPANAELVEPYREELETWAPLAAFGF